MWVWSETCAKTKHTHIHTHTHRHAHTHTHTHTHRATDLKVKALKIHQIHGKQSVGNKLAEQLCSSTVGDDVLSHATQAAGVDLGDLCTWRTATWKKRNVSGMRVYFEKEKQEEEVEQEQQQ